MGIHSSPRWMLVMHTLLLMAHMVLLQDPTVAMMVDMISITIIELGSTHADETTTIHRGHRNILLLQATHDAALARLNLPLLTPVGPIFQKIIVIWN
jgi:hypothetical protein